MVSDTPLVPEPDDDLPPLSPEDAIWTANQMYQPRVAEAIARLCAENDGLRAEVARMREEKAAPSEARPGAPVVITRFRTFAEEDREERCLDLTVPEGGDTATLRVRDGDDAVEMRPTIASLRALRDWLTKNLPDER